MKKSVVAAGLSAGLIGGGVGGVVFGTPLFAGAQEGSSSSTTVDSTAAPKSSDKATSDKSDDKSDKSTDSDEATRSEKMKDRRSDHLQETLKPLVEAGTITQAQADAVVKAIVDAGPDFRGRGVIGRHIDRAFRGLHELTDLFDMTTAEIGKALADGQTLAQIADSKGVSTQKVIDTLVAPVKTRLDEAVKEGHIDQDQADERLADATKAITKAVNEGSLKDLVLPGRLGDNDRSGGPRGDWNKPESDSGSQGD